MVAAQTHATNSPFDAAGAKPPLAFGKLSASESSASCRECTHSVALSNAANFTKGRTLLRLITSLSIYRNDTGTCRSDAVAPLRSAGCSFKESRFHVALLINYFLSYESTVPYSISRLIPLLRLLQPRRQSLRYRPYHNHY